MDEPRTINDLRSIPNVLKHLQAGNDAAERAVKLATDYNNGLTKEDEERKLIFHVKYNSKKKTYMS